MTRATLMTLLRERGHTVVEERYARRGVHRRRGPYFTGTAAEVDPGTGGSTTGRSMGKAPAGDDVDAGGVLRRDARRATPVNPRLGWRSSSARGSGTLACTGPHAVFDTSQCRRSGGGAATCGRRIANRPVRC